jgi:hypothetical protein
MCRSVLEQFNCFNSIEKKSWLFLSSATRYRYINEANRHSANKPCARDAVAKKTVQKSVSSHSGNDNDCDADCELSEQEDDEEEGGVVENDDPNAYDETQLHEDEHNPDTVDGMEGVDTTDVIDDTPRNETNEIVVNPSAGASGTNDWTEFNVEGVAQFDPADNALNLDDIDMDKRPSATPTAINEDIDFDLILRNIAIERHFSGETVDYIMNALKKNNSHPMFQSLPKSHKTLYSRNRYRPILEL